MMDAEKTGKLISQRRNELNMSQKELAELLHVTDKAISRWETGRGMPSIDSLEPLAQALHLTVSELLRGSRLNHEEMPAVAGKQIIHEIRRQRKMLWLGAAVSVIIILLAVGLWLGFHYMTSASEYDTDALIHQAFPQLQRCTQTSETDPDSSRICYEEKSSDSAAETLTFADRKVRGNYLALLCNDSSGKWILCVYDRDPVFRNRWRGGTGKFSDAGTLSSWNYGSPQKEAVIIFFGGQLPQEARWYTFQNSGILYTCPILKNQVLDIFVLPDERDISSYPETILDEHMVPVIS